MHAIPTAQPEWTTLQSFLAAYFSPAFMYMGAYQQGDVTITLYKHSITRQYLNIGNDGRLYDYQSAENCYTLVDLDQCPIRLQEALF